MSSQYLVHQAELQQYEQKIADLKQRIKESMDQERPVAIAEVKAVLAKFAGFKLKAVELGLSTPKGQGRPKRPRMIYHDPVAKKTWQGKGKKPKWVLNAAEGSLVVTPAIAAQTASTSATSAV